MGLPKSQISAAQKAYAKAGIKPSDVQVVELHGKRFL
jgi:acyl transferase domain-containing protein